MERSDYIELIRLALDEDLGDRGDITTKATVPEDAVASGAFVVREEGVLAGLGVAVDVLAEVDDSLEFSFARSDGDPVFADDVIANVNGPARSLLAAERTALNLLSRMSGVATATARFVAAVAGTKARISDTRKTMPGFRALDKYAVRVGGGINHRMGLYDAVMIKDNHLVAGLGIADAVAIARERFGPAIEVTVEVENTAQLHAALATDANRVLLDNMSLSQLKEAVALIDGRLVTEASGGITLENVAEVAATGVDVISIGWITHSPPQLDIALDFHSR